MTYNTLVFARINETGDIRMVLAVDSHFEGNGKAYCLKMTDEDINKGLQPAEWFSEALVTLVDEDVPSYDDIHKVDMYLRELGIDRDRPEKQI